MPKSPPVKALIEETVTTGVTHVASNNRLTVNPNGERTASVAANPLYEYVAGGQYAWSSSYLKSLPWWIDDTTRDFGDDLYERMMLDPQVKASINVLKKAVLSQGITVTPVGADTSDDADPMPAKIADFITRQFAGLQTPLYTVLTNMLDAVALGNRVAELIFQPGAGPDAGLICLQNIKPKPRRSTAFVVDVYLNTIGILGLIPGQGAPILVEGMIGNPEQVPNLLPLRKFLVMTWEPRDCDPRGSSILRPAYNAWWMKMQIYPEYLKYLTMFASPSLIGVTDADAQAIPVTDSDGNPVLDVNGNTQYTYPEQILLTQLLALHNSTAIAVPHGTEVKPLVTAGDGNGDPFVRAIALFNAEITKAILSQTLATDEGQHDSRGAAQTHQDIMQLIISSVREFTQDSLVRQVVRPLIEMNFGVDALRYTPEIRLAEVPREDLSEMGAVVAALTTSGYLSPSQYPGIDAMLNLPPRDAPTPGSPNPNAPDYDSAEFAAARRMGAYYDRIIAEATSQERGARIRYEGA